MDEHSAESGVPVTAYEAAAHTAADERADPLMDMVGAAGAGTQAPDPLRQDPASGRDFLSFYGLAENPFADSVNADYFYRTQTHETAIEKMTMAVRYNVSLAMITGVSGSGKTLISQILLQNLDPDTCAPILVLVTPGLSKTGLLRVILSELNVALPVGISRTQDLVRLLGNQVIDLFHEGRRLVILIDECHFLRSESLHILRTISNIEIPDRKLVTCLLFGEPRFARRLQHAAYEAIRSRMYMRCELAPMTAGECAEYVRFRLMMAQRLEPLFDDAALDALYEGSGGVCRALNKLAMLALIEGAGRGMARIGAGVVDACAEAF